MCNIKFTGTFRELTLSTIATTISIILTFGTAHYVEQKEKKAAARQTAMMVIHDMENTARNFRKMAKQEEKYREMTRYVMQRMAEIDSLNLDTAFQVFIYISAIADQKQLYTLDESSERVFLSSQESWKNIDNPTFIDEVQDFYASRHEIYDYINTSTQWQKPLSSQVLYQHQLNRDNGTTDERQLLKQALKSREVRYYLNYSAGRQTQLNQFADQFQHTSDICKFNIGITDEELEEYVRNTGRTGRNVKEQEIIGRWIMSATDEQYSVIEYFENHTYCQMNIIHLSHPIYDGRMDLKYVSNGTWELRGDTLHNTLQPGYKFETDHSHIIPKPGMEQEVETYVENLQRNGREQQKASAARQARHRAYRATINASGNKIELKWTEHDDDEDNDTEQAIYLSREK